ncbi:hypothetical protein N7462_007119 [Penicillium macrosclerotiorum]|uniref:uncharacterized protein n=1 Tax=Penicillium macrosclerotiorum TaxID=303699 RepID=UPI002548666E|nr:uncharacterized protein N7462_007119 [Penicillium macrosclerotiorum]KAJ5678875.1 hypothetical protein N7462_007119 [Penicillium macrosclerotiorum]
MCKTRAKLARWAKYRQEETSPDKPAESVCWWELTGIDGLAKHLPQAWHRGPWPSLANQRRERGTVRVYPMIIHCGI